MKAVLALLLSATVCGAMLPPIVARAEPTMPRTTKYKIDERGGGGLYTATAGIEVFAEPKAGSKLLETYKKGAMMAVLGTAVGTDYLYVSPCNACDNGFVRQEEFFAKTKR